MVAKGKAVAALVFLLTPLLAACLFHPRDPRERIEHVTVVVEATLDGKPVQNFCVVAQSFIGDFGNMYGPYWAVNGVVEFELEDVPVPLEVAIGKRSGAIVVGQVNWVNGPARQFDRIFVVVTLDPWEKVEDIECHRWQGHSG